MNTKKQKWRRKYVASNGRTVTVETVSEDAALTKAHNILATRARRAGEALQGDWGLRQIGKAVRCR